MRSDPRPALHFQPPVGWVNDPNGLVCFDGEWHLCYQHHPHSADRGPMHWGHAVSTDLVAWTDLPIALHPDTHGAVYSGSAVVDRGGSAGFGRNALVAVYTQFTPTSQVQSIAGSTDRGRTWQPHEANPVLRQPPGVVDFRDPKVLWFSEPDGRDGRWLMVLAVGGEVRLYASPNLVDWEQVGVFAPERGRPHGVWETPDLYPLPVPGTTAERWVLSAGAAARGPAGGSGTRYWTGAFDGATFAADGPARWVDHGADFYAAQSWSDAPGGRRVWIAWMSNWDYAASVPAGAARGQLTLPRQLRLAGDGRGGLHLAQRPVAETEAYLGAPVTVGDRPVALEPCAGRIAVEARGDRPVSVVVTTGAGGAQVTVDPAAATVSVDRTDVAGVGHGFAGVQVARRVGVTDAPTLDVWVDHSSVEVFADEGRVCLTALVPDLRLGGPVQVAVHGDGLSHATVRPVARRDAC